MRSHTAENATPLRRASIALRPGSSTAFVIRQGSINPMNQSMTESTPRPAHRRIGRQCAVAAAAGALLATAPAFATNGYFAHGYFSLFGAMLAELFPTRIRASAEYMPPPPES